MKSLHEEKIKIYRKPDSISRIRQFRKQASKKTVFHFQMSNVGHNLKEEMERVLIMISQFAFIHGDTNLLCLALLRRPQEPPLTLSGFATLQRSLLSKTLAFVLLVMLLIANYKMDDYSKSTDGDSFFDKLTKIN